MISSHNLELKPVPSATDSPAEKERPFAGDVNDGRCRHRRLGQPVEVVRVVLKVGFRMLCSDADCVDAKW